MISSIFKTIFYTPLYNALVFLIDTLPWFDIGIIIVLFTIIVKLVLFPLSHKSVKAQMEMKKIQPEIDQIKDKYKDKQEQTQKIMDLYRKYKINPLASLGPIIIQIPIIFSLYFIFLRGGLPEINTDILYSFVKSPENIRMTFLGIFNMMEKSIILSVLVGISQFIHTSITIPKKTKPFKLGESFKGDLAHSFQLQMKYVLPIVVAFISYGISSAVSIYWVTSNVFMIAQEFVVKRKMKEKS